MAKPAKLPRDTGSDDIDTCFPGTREEAVAEGRADIAAGRVYTAAAMAAWVAVLGTESEYPIPDRDWDDAPAATSPE